jgi:hypothetical protein
VPDHDHLDDDDRRAHDNDHLDDDDRRAHDNDHLRPSRL